MRRRRSRRLFLALLFRATGHECGKCRNRQNGRRLCHRFHMYPPNFLCSRAPKKCPNRPSTGSRAHFGESRVEKLAAGRQLGLQNITRTRSGGASLTTANSTPVLIVELQRATDILTNFQDKSFPFKELAQGYMDLRERGMQTNRLRPPLQAWALVQGDVRVGACARHNPAHRVHRRN